MIATRRAEQGNSGAGQPTQDEPAIPARIHTLKNSG